MSSYTHDAAGVSSVIASARSAQLAWAETSWAERSVKLKAVERYLADNADSLAATIGRASGKTHLDALATEIVPALMALRYYRTHGKAFMKSERIPLGNILLFNKRSRLVYKPYGVIGIISPWNYPFAIPFSEVVMALLSGNAVVLKVASDSIEVGRVLESAFASAGLPEGIFTYIEMPGREAGPAFIAAGVDKLFFTGSTEVGRELMALASTRLLPLVLELGGADAAIVCEDADLLRAANGILWAGFSNAGQSCGGCQRILVHESVYEPFLDILSAKVKALRVAAGTDPDSDMGAMSSLKQKKTVAAQIQECLAAGAKIAAQSAAQSAPQGAPQRAAPDTGTLDDDSLFMPAILLVNVKPDMPVMKDEIFGPVVALVPYANDGEALKMANASSYGLTASVWSRNGKRARGLAERLEAGAVTINDHLMSHGLAETPWGGFKNSGIGQTHGRDGFREMLRKQVIVRDIMPGAVKDLWWHPYSKKVYLGLRSIVDFQFGASLWRRIRALPRLVSLVFRYWDRA